MADQKRDESRDIGVSTEGLALLRQSSVYPTMTAVIPLAPGGDAMPVYARYVPHADLVAAEERITAERDTLSDIKSWASEEINELRSELDDSERARKSAEFYLSITTGDVVNMSKTIAEQRARIEALREGLLSIQSDPTNASKDAEFYLNRDE